MNTDELDAKMHLEQTRYEWYISSTEGLTELLGIMDLDPVVSHLKVLLLIPTPNWYEPVKQEGISRETNALMEEIDRQARYYARKDVEYVFPTVWANRNNPDFDEIPWGKTL